MILKSSNQAAFLATAEHPIAWNTSEYNNTEGCFKRGSSHFQYERSHEFAPTFSDFIESSLRCPGAPDHLWVFPDAKCEQAGARREALRTYDTTSSRALLVSSAWQSASAYGTCLSALSFGHGLPLIWHVPSDSVQDVQAAPTAGAEAGAKIAVGVLAGAGVLLLAGAAIVFLRKRANANCPTGAVPQPCRQGLLGPAPADIEGAIELGDLSSGGSQRSDTGAHQVSVSDLMKKLA
ncbi:MAG TPA: hypothetical protein VFH51_03495 [Myxococcota bacterium]|nr:hypothetical protein [Myxococcota bacterium]